MRRSSDSIATLRGVKSGLGRMAGGKGALNSFVCVPAGRVEELARPQLPLRHRVHAAGRGHPVRLAPRGVGARQLRRGRLPRGLDQRARGVAHAGLRFHHEHAVPRGYQRRAQDVQAHRHRARHRQLLRQGPAPDAGGGRAAAAQCALRLPVGPRHRGAARRQPHHPARLHRRARGRQRLRQELGDAPGAAAVRPGRGGPSSKPFAFSRFRTRISTC